MKFTLVLIDDEPYVLKDFIDIMKPIGDLEIIYACSSISEALVFLRKEERVNFVFSDISMPGISGIEGGKALAEYCDLLVYMTGFPDYYADAFKVGAKGYLLKPASVEDVLKLMGDLRKIKSMELQKRQRPEFMIVKSLSEKDSYKISLKDVLYISNWGNYLKIHTQNQVFIKYSSMKEIENELCSWGDFNRINQSAIIALKAISSVANDKVLLLNGRELSISRSRKSAFFETYNGDIYRKDFT